LAKNVTADNAYTLVLGRPPAEAEIVSLAVV
jgi:hypothetical protein